MEKAKFEKKSPETKTHLHWRHFCFFILLLLLPTFVSALNNKLYTPPPWVENAVIYQVNLRQYSETDPLIKLRMDLKKLKELGVEIIWLMPIHPIGELNKKGSLGSPYAIKDYRKINPEFTHLSDPRLGMDKDEIQNVLNHQLMELINQAHSLGIYIILDWVANHTAWDHVWTKTHPDYYLRDEYGNFTSPREGKEVWEDVISLDFTNPKLWDEMKNEMAYWITTFKIDGFRCDAAQKVGLPFWESARPFLEKVKVNPDRSLPHIPQNLITRPDNSIPHQANLFFLAEGDYASYQTVFDAVYNWALLAKTQEVANHLTPAYSVRDVLINQNSEWIFPNYPKGSLFLNFTSNHDENSWRDHEFVRFQYNEKALKLFTTLNVITKGVPMIYNGQEIGMKQRLAFFDKDLIRWKDEPSIENNSWFLFYQNLFKLKQDSKALKTSAEMEIIHTHSDYEIVALRRYQNQDEVIYVANTSPYHQNFNFKYDEYHGRKIIGCYQDYISRNLRYYNDWGMSLEGYEYKILVKKNPSECITASKTSSLDNILR